MKILFVAHDGRDGIGTHSAGLRAALPAALPAADELVVAGLAGRRSRRGSRVIGQQLRLPFTERDADLVHLPDFRPTLIDRRPTLLTVHDVCFLDHPEWFPRSVYRYKSTLLRLIRAKRPAAIVCVSAYTERALARNRGGGWLARWRAARRPLEPTLSGGWRPDKRPLSLLGRRASGLLVL